jgi:hypothetical protein
VGLIRKTLSVSTLGIVDFRSKKEQLRRAEKAHRAARAELVGEQAARSTADQRIAAAEKRARQAELLALQQAKKADIAKGGRRARRRAAASQAFEAIEGFVTTNTPVVEERAKDLGRRGRKAAAKAAKQAEAAAAKARKEARKQAKRAKQKLDEVGDAASEFVKEHT